MDMQNDAGWPALLRRDPDAAGQRLRGVIWTDEAVSLIGREYGWNDGGCLVLADALSELMPQQAHRMAIVMQGRGKVGQHFVVRVDTNRGPRYVDGDGVNTSQRLLARLRQFYGRMGEPQLVDIAESEISAETVRDPRLSSSVCAWLHVRLCLGAAS